MQTKALIFLTFCGLLLAPLASALPVDFVKNGVVTDFWAQHPKTADIDGDGHLDIVASDFFTSQLVWWRNVDGDGTSWSLNWITGNFPTSLEIHTADMDGDGDIDVVARSFTLDEIVWFENRNGVGFSWPKHVIDPYTIAIGGLDVGDINADGYPDILQVTDVFEKDEILWWENPGPFGTEWYFSFIAEEYGIATAGHLFDADGDGDLDVAVAGSDPDLGYISVYLNDDTLGFDWTHVEVEAYDEYISDDLTINRLETGDMDGDGDLDLIAPIFSVRWWENPGDGTSWTHGASAFSGLFDTYLNFDIGDLDGDGDLDIATMLAGSDQLVWFENKISGFILLPHELGTMSTALGISLGDIDGDGDLDVIASGDNEEIAWFEATPTIPTCAPPPANGRAWYPLDETMGFIANDAINDNDGAHFGGPTKLASGQVDGALQFDGSNDYVRISDDWRLDFGHGDFTIEGWVKTTDANGVIASKRALVNGKHVGYLLMVYGGRLLLQIGDTTNGWYNYHPTFGPTIDDGQWHHVAARVDRNNASGGRLYVDGYEVHVFDPRNRQGNTSNGASLELGRTTGGGDHLQGTLDEIALYSRALSASEILAISDAGSEGKCKVPAGPLGVNLSCAVLGPGIHRCTATGTGGGGSFSYLWSYAGNGSISPAGNVAIVEMGSCSNGGGTITVTVTDGAGDTTSTSRALSCPTGCLPGQICLE